MGFSSFDAKQKINFAWPFFKIRKTDFVLHKKIKKVKDMGRKRRHISIPKHFAFQSNTLCQTETIQKLVVKHGIIKAKMSKNSETTNIPYYQQPLYLNLLPSLGNACHIRNWLTETLHNAIDSLPLR